MSQHCIITQKVHSVSNSGITSVVLMRVFTILFTHWNSWSNALVVLLCCETMWNKTCADFLFCKSFLKIQYAIILDMPKSCSIILYIIQWSAQGCQVQSFPTRFSGFLPLLKKLIVFCGFQNSGVFLWYFIKIKGKDRNQNLKWFLHKS